MKIMIFGSNGLLGSNLYRYFSLIPKYRVIPIDKSIDIRDFNAVLGIINKENPDFCINAVAMSDPDSCELDPKKALDINYIGAMNITNAGLKFNAQSIHFSSDYVYSGVVKEYWESDLPDPLQFYGKTKMAMENSLQAKSVILRIPFLYGINWAKNSGFVNTVYHKIINKIPLYISDQRRRYFTWVWDVCKYVEQLINSFEVGVYNLSNNDNYSKYEVVEKILKAMKLTSDDIFMVIEGHTYIDLANRPTDLYKLNTDLLFKKFGNLFSNIDIVLNAEINAFIDLDEKDVFDQAY